jgi:hypothetical protein
MSEPPPGHTPNFINPESRAWVAQTVIVLGVAFVVMFVALRIYQRGFVTRSFGWDDGTCFCPCAVFQCPSAYSSPDYSASTLRQNADEHV